MSLARESPLLIGALLFTAPLIARGRETGFLNRSVRVGNATYRYQVYVPADWSKAKRWPVILFLHGAGERGEDGLIQTEVGIGTAIRRHPDRVPAIVVMPQCRPGLWWSMPDMEAQAMAALDRSAKEFNGDPDRLYLTGLSMGGYGTWSIARDYPNRFAGFAPICGGIRPPEGARIPAGLRPLPEEPYAATSAKVGRAPVWIFHGGADPVVPPAESRRMNEALKTAGATVKYTEYEGVGHNSWDRAYGEPEFFRWLLAQKRVKQ
jgi:predicted peptidase